MYSRRDFGKMALAVPFTAAPLANAWGKRIDSTVKGVRLGTITYSFRDFPRAPGKDNVDAIITALVECGIGEIELFSPNVEPGRAGGFGRGSSPEAAKAREELRQWRLSTPPEYFQAIRKKFDDAGISIYAYTMNYRDDFTDAEIDKTFEQARALGVNLIASSTQVSMARRLLGFAEKHNTYLAFHGHAEYDKPDEFSTPETFQKALDISKYAKVNLDIGHFTAANQDAVAYIEKHHDRISHLHVKDRKRNKGDNVEWGRGDTPIKEVLALLRDKRYPIPAFIEYEYKGTGTSVEEVKKCLAYMRNALA
jgi:sugar phosphate isomerase/epimerase